MASVDVVIPSYNYGRYLTRCVESVVSQRDVDVRVLVIDDASNDETELVARALALRHDNVKYTRHPTNEGHIATFNEGVIEWASADYTLLLSADDLLTPGALARAANVFAGRTNVGLVLGQAIVIEDGEPLPTVQDDTAPRVELLSGASVLREFCLRGNPVPSPAVIVRTAIQRAVGPYSADMLHTSDMEMWMRFAVYGDVAAISAPQAYYRWHGSNMSSRYYSQFLSDRAERIETCRKVLRHHGHEVPELSNWVNEMERQLALEAVYLAGQSLSGARDASGNMMSFAHKHHPRLWTQLPWWKFQGKRALGPRFSNQLRFLLGAISTSKHSVVSGGGSFAHGSVVGWGIAGRP
jgi:glycosyltransferase involved in cell wall biosynthesis